LQTQEIYAQTRDAAICTRQRCCHMHIEGKYFVSLSTWKWSRRAEMYILLAPVYAATCFCLLSVNTALVYQQLTTFNSLLSSTNSLLSTTNLNQHQPANINLHQSATVKQQQPATVEGEALFSGSCAAPALLHHGSHVQASWVPEVRLVHGRVRYHRNSYHCNRYHCNRHHCNRHHCNKTGRRPREASLQQTAA